jgi:hypothetical protein
MSGLSARRYWKQAAGLASVSLILMTVVLAPTAESAPIEPAFADRGVRTLSEAGNGRVNDTAVRSDGSIMVVGRAGGKTLIAKLTASGAVEKTFGSNGFAPQQQFAFSSCPRGICGGSFNSVWPGPQGSTIVAGWQGTGSGIAKLSAQGTWEPESANFGGFGFYDGYRNVRLSDTARAPDGTFTSVGSGGGRTRKGTGATAFQFDSDGSTAFRWGNVIWGGEVDNNLHELQWPQAVKRGVKARMTGIAIPQTRTRYATGWIRLGRRAEKRMFVTAIGKNGGIINRFGATRPGISVFGIRTRGGAIVGGPRLETYVAGTKDAGGTSRIIVAKLDSRGRLLEGFGHGGIVTLPAEDASARSIALVGKRLYVGGTTRSRNGTRRAVIASFTTSGAPRRSFGKARRFVSNRLATVNSIEELPNDSRRLILGGTSRSRDGEAPAVAFLND